MSTTKGDFAKNKANSLVLPQISDAFGRFRMNRYMHYLVGSTESPCGV